VGITTAWRQLKPELMETLANGWAALRWCTFVEPMHGYTGRNIEIEVVLANEDTLKPGMYPVHVKVFGCGETVWEKKIDICVPQPEDGKDTPLTIEVLRETIALDVEPGAYELAVSMEHGGAPTAGRRTFHLSAPSYPHTKCPVTLLGIEKNVEEWLKLHGVSCRQFDETGQDAREILLIGDLSVKDTSLGNWKEILERIARGSAAVFLSPLAFKRGDDSVGWLPLLKKGSCYKFFDWIYHKECVAKAHPLFEGLQKKGVMDWDYYDQVIPRYVFEGQDTPDDVAAAYFATGYNECYLGKLKIGYASGVLFAGYPFGHGRFFINTFPILENIDVNPAADRMLINIVRFIENDVNKPLAQIPDDFGKQLGNLYK